MRLLSIFRRRGEAPAAPSVAESGDAVRDARTRARRRLIGAVVLLVIGIIGFPLVFETQPRPVPVDIPIEIPKKDGAPPLAMPAARMPGSDAATSSPGAVLTPQPVDDGVITESSADAGREVAATPPASAVERVAKKPAVAAVGVVETERESTPTSVPVPTTGSQAARKAASTAAPLAVAADSARAKALLEAKPTAAADTTGRFVVQVGAFAEADAARATRLKVEKLGLKTYTQVAQTPSGNRIRVRVGPFGSRSEADAALAKARSAGLTAVVLTL